MLISIVNLLLLLTECCIALAPYYCMSCLFVMLDEILYAKSFIREWGTYIMAQAVLSLMSSISYLNTLSLKY